MDWCFRVSPGWGLYHRWLRFCRRQERSPSGAARWWAVLPWSLQASPWRIICSRDSVAILTLTASGKLELSKSGRPVCGDMSWTLDNGLELFACVFHCESVCVSLNPVPGMAAHEHLSPGNPLDAPVGRLLCV